MSDAAADIDIDDMPFPRSPGRIVASIDMRTGDVRAVTHEARSMSDPRCRFEAYLRAQVDGCTNGHARGASRAHHEQLRATMERLHNDAMGDITITDALAVLTLGEYRQPADPDERVRRGLEWLEGVKSMIGEVGSG